MIMRCRSSILMLSLFLLGLAFQSSFGQEISDGRVNLHNWDSRKPLKLDGPWRVWQGIEAPEIAIQSKARLMDVGTEFRNTPFEALKSGQGSLTYHLILENLNAEDDLSLRLRADTAFQVFFFRDGEPPKLIKEIGHISNDADQRIPQIANPILRLPASDYGTYHLVIQVQNYFYSNGGIWQIPTIQAYDQGFQTWNTAQLLEIIAIGIVFILTCYNLAVFFQRREEKANLWLAGFCVFILARLLAISGFFYYGFFPEPTHFLYQLQRRCEFGAATLSSAFILAFLEASFFPHTYRRIIQYYAIAAAVTSLGALVMPVDKLSYLIPLIDAVLLVSFGLGSYLTIKAVVKRRVGAKIILLGILLLIVTVAHDILLGMGALQSGFFLTHFGACALVFCLGQVVAKLFAIAFRTSERLSKHLEKEVQAKTRDIRTMLDNIPHGILSIIEGRKIDPHYSKHLEDIVDQREIAGQDLISLILVHSSLNQEQLSMIDSALTSSIGEDVLNFEANSCHLPHEFTYKVSQHEKILECNWSPVVNGQDIVEKVLLVLKDVTKLRKFEQESIEQKIELEYILEIVNVPVEKFAKFIVSAQMLLDENHRLLNCNELYDVEVIKILFVNMHTIKGAARSLHFNKMTSVLHEVEQRYADLLKTNTPEWDTQVLLRDLQRAESMVDKYIHISEQKLGRSLQNDHEMVIDREFLTEKANRLASIDVTRLDANNAEVITTLIKDFSEIVYDNIADVFQDILSNVNKIARDLGKADPVIDYKSRESFGLSYEGQQLLRNIFTHIIRNSLDHGIETEKERVAKGKLPTGKIHLSLQVLDDYLTISYQDDGRGLNLEAIEQKALAAGLIHSGESKRSDMKIASLIFASGLSTAKTVSDISGRGVGMDAVKRYIEKSGGEILMEFTRDHYDRTEVSFRFLIKIPKTYYTIFKEKPLAS